MIYRSSEKRPHWILLAVAVLLITLTLRGYIGMIRSCGEYVRLSQRPLVVWAKVVAHEEKKDNEGESTYYSYISYDALGEEYRRVKYQSTSFRRELKEVGTTFKLELNPEDPGERLDQVSNPRYISCMATMLGCSLALFLHTLRRMRNSVTIEGPVDEEVVRRGLREWVRCNYVRTAVVLTVLLRVPVQLCFPMLVDAKALLGILVQIALGVDLICDTVKVRRLIQAGAFRISADMLAEKTDEKMDMYKLRFSGAQGEWEILLNGSECRNIRLDAPFYSVWLPDHSYPALKYRPVNI